MGILEFFGSLSKSNITSSAINMRFIKKMGIDHLFLDFNSIIHVSSQKILEEVNSFLQIMLKNLYHHRPFNSFIYDEYFKKYKMESIKNNFDKDMKPEELIRLMHEHFNDNKMDNLVYSLVIETIAAIVNTYCDNDRIKTLYLAIDGVPSKGKLMEQRHRKYLGVFVEKYKKKITHKYKKYLEDADDYKYLSIKHSIKWSRVKITPGTVFMHKLLLHLKSDRVQELMLLDRPNMKIIVSGMYSVGEGEKKIVNYVNDQLQHTTDTVVIYSPDADMILLCILLQIENVYMLRHNQQLKQYDLINVKMLKSNISYYINNHPEHSKEKFIIDNINYDLVCVSTLFGNDFVPKIETLNVKRGFQNIMDAYLKVLLKHKNNQTYLVSKNNGRYDLNFNFLKDILKELLPEENDFIEYNNLYNEFINIGQIKNAFDYMTINEENLFSTFKEFEGEYFELKNAIKNNSGEKLSYFETHDQFMHSLKKSIAVIIDNVQINTMYLSNKELISLLKKYYSSYKDFPRLNINLRTYSKSVTDMFHVNNLKKLGDINEYKKEMYKFDNMLDEYYVKFNAEPLKLSKNNIEKYYREYFDITLYKGKELTDDAKKILYEYIEGTIWVFEYYFNDSSYINTWYYQHERSPLLNHISIFLDQNTEKLFKTITDGIKKYRVDDEKKYFNPLEQLIYVSPMVPDVIKLLPSNYRNFLSSENLNPFLKNFYVNVDEIVERLWKASKTSDIDCKSIPYLNKCFLTSLKKPSSEDDIIFLKNMRSVKQTKNSLILSGN